MVVFSATMGRDRAELGNKVTAFLDTFEGEIVDTIVKQSSDHAFHCVTILLFLNDFAKPAKQEDEIKATIDQFLADPDPAEAYDLILKLDKMLKPKRKRENRK